MALFCSANSAKFMKVCLSKRERDVSLIQTKNLRSLSAQGNLATTWSPERPAHESIVKDAESPDKAKIALKGDSLETRSSSEDDESH